MTVTTSTNRRADADGLRFIASAELASNLQSILVDLIELHVQGKQAHWNVVGTNFRDLHLQLDELIAFARESSDDIAERMRALGVAPDGRTDTVAASTTLPAYPAAPQQTRDTAQLITGRIAAAAYTIRTVHDAVDKADPFTADILHAITDGLEKHAWMFDAEIHSH